MKTYQVDENGYYGEFGGAYVPENTSPMCGKLAEEVSGSIGKRQFQE